MFLISLLLGDFCILESFNMLTLDYLERNIHIILIFDIHKKINVKK